MCAQNNDSRYYYRTSRGEADLGGGICFAMKRKKGRIRLNLYYNKKKGAAKTP